MSKTKRVVSAPVTSPARSADWRRIYSGRLAVTDTLAIIWVVFAVQLLRFGFDETPVSGLPNQAAVSAGYALISVILIVSWAIMLGIYGSRDYRVLGTGFAEYKRIVDASIRLFGLVAIVAFLMKIDLARGYVLLAFPAGILVLIFTRWLWRQWLGVQRASGHFVSRVLLIGAAGDTKSIGRELQRVPAAGYMVVGEWLPTPAEANHTSELNVPVFFGDVSAQTAMSSVGADTVVVTNAQVLGPNGVRELSWSLEPGRQHLIMAPNLTDISGPRIHTRPVAGLPLIHVETPRYEGSKLFTKRAFDIFGSATLLLLLSVPLLVIAALVKFTSPGPVLYRQERVGLNRQHFGMVKFRSMRQDADDELSKLLAAQGRQGKPLFKIKNDPRVTRVGKVLRKYSLDEFPQLFNVLSGSMSLVGPRPQRDGEVELYDKTAFRRLLVKPGMSGLWQVSGRSSLSWEDAIRLDLYYVENWSMIGDLIILWRTMKAVVSPGETAA
jgi:exopolysaccharide biosynthesis polyprenyl glycosylphosphotransferase